MLSSTDLHVQVDHADFTHACCGHTKVCQHHLPVLRHQDVVCLQEQSHLHTQADPIDMCYYAVTQQQQWQVLQMATFEELMHDQTLMQNRTHKQLMYSPRPILLCDGCNGCCCFAAW